MERLTKWIDDGEKRQAIPDPEMRSNGHNKCCNKLAEYEDLEEQGRLLRLPFSLESERIYVVEKYGMKIYKLDAEKIEISKMPISNDILYEIDGFELTFLDFGEIAFLTREEAESKLKEMEESHEWG